MIGTLWITGVSGFTGRHMVCHMLAQADRPRLVGLDMAAEGPAGLDAYHCIDINRVEDLTGLARAEPPQWVIHLAGAMPPAPEAAMWQVNVGGTMSLLEALAAADCRSARVLGIGSAAEYVPQPGEALSESSPSGGSSAYGRTKWAQTLLTLSLATTLGMPAMVARPFNLIGPGLPSRLVAGALCEQFARPEVEEVVVGNVESARDFVDVRDVVNAYWLLACRGVSGEIYNVCTGVPHTIEYLISLMREVSGRSPHIRIDADRFRQTDPAVSYGDCSKLVKATGWRPSYSLRDSVEAMLAPV